MDKIHTSIIINAPREKVWDIMLADETYREWTTVFHPGSYYRGDWSEGSKILFIGPGENGEEMGMVSRIKENRKPEFISIEHLGIFKNGVEDTSSEEAKKWSPAFENYSFLEEGGNTKVVVDMDIQSEHKESFLEMWQRALKKLKDIVERE